MIKMKIVFICLFAACVFALASCAKDKPETDAALRETPAEAAPFSAIGVWDFAEARVIGEDGAENPIEFKAELGWLPGLEIYSDNSVIMYEMEGVSTGRAAKIGNHEYRLVFDTYHYGEQIDPIDGDVLIARYNPALELLGLFMDTRGFENTICYLRRRAEEDALPLGWRPGETALRFVVPEKLNFRMGPSTSHNIMTVLNRGDMVVISLKEASVQDGEHEWIRALFHHEYGYVDKRYLRE